MRLLLWFLALALGILGVWAVWGGGFEARLSFAGTVELLEKSRGWAWAAGSGLLIADVLLPVPGTVVMSALGAVYGALLGGVIASLGSMGAGLAAYGAGRAFGEKTARRLLGDRDFERGHRLFARGGGWLVAVSRTLPVLPEAIACTAGLARMPFRRFVLALACGSLPMGFVFAAVGAAGLERPGLALALSLAIPVVLWLAARRGWQQDETPGLRGGKPPP